MAAGVQALRRGSPTQDWLIPFAIGVAFVTFAGAFVAITLRSMRQMAEAAVLRQQYSDQPWMWRKEWASGALTDELSGQSVFLFVFGLIWTAISVGVLYAALRGVQGRDPRLLFALIFPATGAVILAVAGYQMLRRQKYGTSRCIVDRIPIEPGREFRGEIDSRVRQQAEHGFVLRLTCVRRVTTGSGKSRSTSETILWRDEKSVSAAMLARNPLGTHVVFAFTLPDDALPTDIRNPSNEVVWRLDVSADVPGIDYAARFQLPIFNAGAAPFSAHEVILDDTAAASRMPSVESGVTITPAPEGEQIVVPSRARGKDIAGSLVFAVIWFGFTIAMFRFGAPLLFAFIFAAVGLLVVTAMADNAVGRSTIWASRERVEVRRVWFSGIGTSMRIPSDSIASIAANVSMTTGGGSGTPYYSVDIVQKDGRKRSVARGIRDRDAAQMIAARLRLIIGLTR